MRARDVKWVGEMWWFAAVLVLASTGAAQAQAASAASLAGNWQGTLELDKTQRIVLKVTTAGEAGGKPVWKGLVYNLDSAIPYEGRNTTQMSVEASAVRFTIAPLDMVYEGRLSPDGHSLTGKWTQGGKTHALTLARADGDAAWAIPAPDKLMAADADPDWEVVSVRPGDPNKTNRKIGPEGREVVVRRHTVETMLVLGYSLHKRQLINAPDWISTEPWDVTGVADVPGMPNVKQLQSMMRKLLVERFGLVSHTEQREIPVYALTLAKSGMKLQNSAGDPNGPPTENDSENGGQRTMRMTNASMNELRLLLTFFLDRPVVDQTGLAGRYDFQLKWTFDERDGSRAPTDGTAAPGIFTAIQEQLGLKLEPVKTMTDVMVIDKIERPSAN